ncbi:MAG TPA: sigma-70 family RNA polymerase sigma factor, partial [Gammaproteobacteria bacterium]
QSEHEIAADLAHQIGQGVRAAEQALVARYGPPLHFMLKQRTRDSELALDVRQEALRIVIEKLRAGSLEQPERLGGYLRGIALKLCGAQRRKESRRATTADSDAIESLADDRPDPADQLSDEQLKRTVRALLGELSTPRDRDILTRLYLLEEDKDTICTALGIDSLHFNRVLFRAKQRFRELLVRAEQHGELRLVR